MCGWVSPLPLTIPWCGQQLPSSFIGFCRSGEIIVESASRYNSRIHPSFSDIAADNATSSTISIQLKRSHLWRVPNLYWEKHMTNHALQPHCWHTFPSKVMYISVQCWSLHLLTTFVISKFNIRANLNLAHSFCNHSSFRRNCLLHHSNPWLVAKLCLFFFYIRLNPVNLGDLSTTMDQGLHLTGA